MQKNYDEIVTAMQDEIVVYLSHRLCLSFLSLSSVNKVCF